MVVQSFVSLFLLCQFVIICLDGFVRPVYHDVSMTQKQCPRISSSLSCERPSLSTFMYQEAKINCASVCLQISARYCRFVTLYGEGSILSPKRTWPRFSEGRFDIFSEQKSNLHKKEPIVKEMYLLFNTHIQCLWLDQRFTDSKCQCENCNGS